MIPKALLERPIYPFPDPPYSLTPPAGPTAPYITMSCQVTAKKKTLHKASHVRRRITTRLKCAVNLVVTRGAHTVKNTKGEEVLAFSGKEERNLILESASVPRSRLSV